MDDKRYFNELLYRMEELFWHELSDCAPWKTEFVGVDFIQTQGVTGKNEDEVIRSCVEHIKAAGLVDTLKGPGPFTVFAPTDAAFAKIPKATLDGLLKDKAALSKLLTYHVVSGKVMAADVKPGMVKTVNGQELTVKTEGGVMVDSAKVVTTDVLASNGVIHAIDTVVMPK